MQHMQEVATDGVVLGLHVNALAVVAWALGNLDASAATHDEALALLRDTDNPWVLGVCLALRARTALDRGEPAAE